MRLIINTAHLRFGGAVQVALSFIYECRNYPEHEYHVIVGQGVANSLDETVFPENFRFYRLLFGPFSFRELRQRIRKLDALEKQIQPDCVITTSGPSYWHSTAPQVMGFNLPLYIYPESPFVRGWSLSKKIRMGLKKKLHYYFFKRDAQAYVVQTDDVNQRVRKALNTDQVFTVTNTHNGFYHDWKAYPPKLPPRKPGEVRLLTLSAWYPHKNLDLIPQVRKVLRQEGKSEVTFVLTLPEADFDRHFSAAGQKEGIINIGPVKPKECPSLYQECDIMFLPTLAECFSASYPEAMVMQRPIVTTDLGFARSICGDSALYFSPKDPVHAAVQIKRLLDNEALRDQLIRKGLQQLSQFDSPRQRAAKYLNLCQQLADGALSDCLHGLDQRLPSHGNNKSF